MEASTPAIERSRDLVAGLHKKFEAEPADADSDDDPMHFSVEKLDDGNIRASMGSDVFATIKSMVDQEHAVTEGLQNHLHGIACVALWSSFEGYIQSVLEEVFRADTKLLISEKPISISSVVANADQIIDYLVSQEIESVGRKSFSDLDAYLKSRLRVQVGNKFKTKMEGAYWVRNVVAHTAGYVRPEQASLCPTGVGVFNRQLHVSTEYVRDIADCLKGAVTSLDVRLSELYLVPKASSDDPVVELGSN
jgi:hypothetical protein